MKPIGQPTMDISGVRRRVLPALLLLFVGWFVAVGVGCIAPLLTTGSLAEELSGHGCPQIVGRECSARRTRDGLLLRRNRDLACSQARRVGSPSFIDSNRINRRVHLMGAGIAMRC